jgi:hypothetical protein
MIVLKKGFHKLGDIVASLAKTAGTGSELLISKTMILRDPSANLQEYTAVSSLAKEEIPPIVIDVAGDIGINSQKILTSAFSYNRIYYLNSSDEELIRLEIDEVSETDINIDIIVKLGDSDAVTIVNA